MARSRLRLALVGGPAYDRLYDRIPGIAKRLGIEIEIAVRAPHPELNDCVAQTGRTGTFPFDLISTHIKYAPAQANWLLPLDDLINYADLASFDSELLDHCRFEGRLIQLPRLFDARLLHYRTDLISDSDVPKSWSDVANLAVTLVESGTVTAGFVFPGRSSGLFGTFFELLAANGGVLFDGEGRPGFNSAVGIESLSWLHRLHSDLRVTPRESSDWHFDEVANSFRTGEVAMIGEWPGYFALHRDSTPSAVSKRFGIDRYPVGAVGVRRVYAGSHSFAIGRDCRDLPATVALLLELTSFESQLSEARRGVFPARSDARTAIRAERAHDPLALRQLDLLESIIINGEALRFPQLTVYPEIEEAVWPLLQAGVTGQRSISEALSIAADRVSDILGGNL